MLSAILGFLLSNPTVLAIVGGFVAALGWGYGQRRAGAKAERNRQRAKEADAYERHLEEIAAAHRARNDVRPGGVPDDDPYRRD